MKVIYDIPQEELMCGNCPCRDGNSDLCQLGYNIYGDFNHVDIMYHTQPRTCPAKVIPNNATIADIIKALFGEGEEQVVYSGLGARRCIEFVPDSVKNTKDAYGFHTMGMIFAENLWNAPYNGGLISEEH